MRRTGQSQTILAWNIWKFILVLSALVQTSHLSAQVKTVTLKNGVVLKGEVGTTSKYIVSTGNTGGGVEPIVIVDDRFRRVFTHSSNLRNVPTPVPRTDEVFKIDQQGASRSTKSRGIGSILDVTPFNDYGRRMLRMSGAKGPVTLIQGITRITPLYCVLRTIEADDAVYNSLEMRIATSSMPQDVLSRVMRRSINAENASDRLKIVSFYQQAERYRDAELELQTLIRDFPDLAEEKQRDLKLLRQAWANQLVRELKARVERGQYELALRGIEQFPRSGVASEILLEVGELKQSIEKLKQGRQQVLDQVQANADNYIASTGDKLVAGRKETIEQFVAEINSQLNFDNYGRMSAFKTLKYEGEGSAEENLSLAISGWVVGRDGAVPNIELAFSLLKIRELVEQYLLSETDERRTEIGNRLKEIEGSTPKNLARMIANLRPFLQSKPAADKVGYFELQAPGIGDIEAFNYVVQLPPDYNPYRRYPCVVTLNSGNPVEHQLEWWAGTYDPKLRLRRGQAAIHGYIVISVDWRQPAQAGYQFTIQEHAAVLNSVRDAFKRFSIDTDRVFLSGHASGGTAAWDIGLSHPDMWAGVIPINARADKYISRYWKNPRYNLPMYFVIGERDGDLATANNMDWTRYLEYFGFDIMVVEYQGRGREHFYEDIRNIYDWMNLVSHQRVFAPEKFECSTLRPWDNFFWYLEAVELRKNSTVLPQKWPVKKVSPTTIGGTIIEKNKLLIDTTAESEIVWMAPEFIDFDRPVSINGREESVTPDIMVLLEDARTRCDRQHLYWAKAEISGRSWGR